MQFEINGYKYFEDPIGVIHQIDSKPFKYTEDYISCYDEPGYKENSKRLQEIRLDVMKDVIFHCKSKTLLDYGYGRGDFLRAAKGHFKSLYGYDIAGHKLPEGVKRHNESKGYDILTMFDVLEHIPNLSEFMSTIKSRWVVVSLPDRPPIDKMGTWRHLKPNEHLHHFHSTSLRRMFESFNYMCLIQVNEEDEIRTPQQGMDYNILTSVFECKQ